MGMFVNPDNSAFQVALNSEIYVDKTGLIKYTNRVLNTLQGYICNSRPRRFGKSITANMLTAYYSRGCDSEAIFAGLEISKSADFKKHLNQYDVIHLDIQWCMEPAGGPEQVVSYISEKTILLFLTDQLSSEITVCFSPEAYIISSLTSIPGGLFFIFALNAASGASSLLRYQPFPQVTQSRFSFFIRSVTS